MRTTIDKYIIQRVKEIRKAKGIKQEQIMDRMGLSSTSTFVSQVESEDYEEKYNIYHLNELAKILDCDIADFFPRPYQEVNSLQEYRNAKEEAKRKAKEKREKEKK